MDIFNVLTLLGGLSLFLFGMTFMGQSLERRAGGRLRGLLGFATLMFGMETMSSAVGGTGLGLSIVKHAVMIHNAEIDIRSAVGEGTTVTVRFAKEQGRGSAPNSSNHKIRPAAQEIVAQRVYMEWRMWQPVPAPAGGCRRQTRVRRQGPVAAFAEAPCQPRSSHFR